MEILKLHTANIRHIIAALVMMICCNSMASAKDNPYDIDEHLYQEYLKADKISNSERGIKMADSLYAVAAKSGDKVAECLFLTIPVKYYSRHEEYGKMEAACDKLQKVSIEGGKLTEQWYFWAYHQQALFLIKNDQLFSALEIASKMREDAESRDSHYGIYATMIVVGDIYRIRNDIGLSGENYLKAFEYQQKYLPQVNIARLCAYLGEYYRRKSGRTKEDIQKSSDFVELGLSLASTDNDRAVLLNERAMSLYSGRDIPAFYETYKQCEELYKNIGEDPEFLQIKYRKNILDKNYSKALEIADSLPSEYDREIAQYVIQRSLGNYEQALKNYEKANHTLNLIREQERRGDLSEINARLGNYQLEIANSQLKQERSRTINAALIIICVIIIVALFFMIRFIRKIKRTNQQLASNNEELRAARKRAEESDKMKMVFIQNMSHEIRTPLNAIVGFSNLLAFNDNEFSQEELEEFRSLVNHNCDMLTILIDDILTISDLESGKYVFDFSDTFVNHTCQMALESAKNRAKEGVEIKYVTHLDDSYTVTTDSIRLTQVINNVLVNACKFTEQGSITIEALTKGDKLQISVADTGPGIPEDKSQEIFERFIKLNHFKQGTGLGLSISKMIMERLNGSIYIDTSYRQGAKFVIELPTQITDLP